jgi:hypothetical protein
MHIAFLLSRILLLPPSKDAFAFDISNHADDTPTQWIVPKTEN